MSGFTSGKRAVRRSVVVASAVLAAAVAKPGDAAVWDGGGGGDSWWYNPVNWSGDALPPTGATNEINNGHDFGGEGVVFDPVNDPYANGTIASAPSTYTIGGATGNFRLYLGNGGTATSSKLTIKSGTLQMTDAGDNVSLGRSSSATGVVGVIVQTGGSFLEPSDNIDAGNLNAGVISNGVYDFRGGTLTAGTTSQNHGIRLGAGVGSTGTFISRNNAPGTITVWNYTSASGNPSVGITEFHYNNGGVNTINVQNNMVLNNDGTAARRSHLNLVLDAAPDANGSSGGFVIPEDIGLINVDSDLNGIGNGEAGSGNDLFWNLAGNDSLVDGDTISATFGGYTYNWTIQYDGNISGATISASGGRDVVLIGLSSDAPVPEPASIGLLTLGALTLRRRKRR